MDVGIHVLDVARVFMGEADSVFRRSQSVRPGLHGEDIATVMLAHGGGATSIVDMSYASRGIPIRFRRRSCSSRARAARSASIPPIR